MAKDARVRIAEALEQARRRFITYAKNDGAGYGQYNVDRIVSWDVDGYTPGEGPDEDPDKMELTIIFDAPLLTGTAVAVHRGQEAFQLVVALDEMVCEPEAFAPLGDTPRGYSVKGRGSRQ